MPAYKYECTCCGFKFEIFQSVSDLPLHTCPECGEGVRRISGIFQVGMEEEGSRQSPDRKDARQGKDSPSLS